MLVHDAGDGSQSDTSTIEIFDDAIDDGTEMNVATFDLAASDAGEIKQVVNEMAHALGATLNAREIALGFGRQFSGEVGAQYFGESMDVPQWGTQVVGDGI